MDCLQVQSLLSAYHDGESPSEIRSAVATHLEQCARCSGELAQFKTLSVMAKRLPVPKTPPEVWTRIQACLDANPSEAPDAVSVKRRENRWTWKSRHFGLIATAALVLIATSVVWITRPWDMPDHHHELAADFEHYVQHFHDDAEMAQSALVAKYNGEPVNVTEAASRLGYMPVVAAGLPRGYSLESLHVLEMPCCRCLQAICRRDDGKVFALFEHGEEQPVWFGDRRQVGAQVGGCPCRITQVDQGLVASWKVGDRALSVVGGMDVDEIADFVTHYQDQPPDA